MERDPPTGTHHLIEPIGKPQSRHKVINGNYLFHLAGRGISHWADQLPGFYYGRFDVKYKDWNSLLVEDFSLMEINGVNAEPTHLPIRLWIV